MGKYASETGTSAAVQKFRPDFPKINESTIGEFKKKYKEELKLAKQQNREVRTALSTEKQGRPLLLGTKIDNLVQRYIRVASNRGAVVTRSTAELAAKALMIRYPNEVGKINLNDSEYGKSVLQRMNYTRRKGTTSKVACVPVAYVPVASTALAKRNSKQVSIKGSDDKRSITATFTITMDGKFF